MITINRNNPTPGEITSSLTNASDAAGLHFDGAAGYVSAGDTTVLDGATRCSVEVIAATSSTTEGDVVSKCRATTALRLYFKADGKIHFRLNNDSSNGDATSAGSYNDGNPKHIVATWDALKLRIYVNGNLDGEGDLVGGSFKDVADFLAIGAQVDASASASYFEGIVYRARLWNKSLTQGEVRASYENATVPFADQYGSQTEMVVNGDFAADSDWTKRPGWTIAGGAAVATSAASGFKIYQTVSGLTVGKPYRLSFEVSAFTSGSVLAYAMSTANSTSTLSEIGSASVEFTATHTAHLVSVMAQSASTSLSVDNVSVVRIGCVADYDLAFANPSPSPNGQSLMVRDRASAADGTSSASGVTQVTPIEQLNSKSARIGTSQATPADGDLVVSGNVGIGVTPSQHLHIDDSTKANILLTRTAGVADTTTEMGSVFFGNNDTSKYLCSINGVQDGVKASGKLTFATQPDGGSRTTRLTIDSAGLATFSKGINLGNTVSATATTLDGYEEGTFIVGTASDATGEFAGGGTNETGEYTRIGNCVYVRIAIRVGTNFTANALSGLPFGPVVDATVSSWIPLGVCLTGSATNSPIVAAVQNGAANIKFLNDSVTTSSHLPNTTHQYYRVNGFYYTNDAF